MTKISAPAIALPIPVATHPESCDPLIWIYVSLPDEGRLTAAHTSPSPEAQKLEICASAVVAGRRTVSTAHSSATFGGGGGGFRHGANPPSVRGGLT